MTASDVLEALVSWHKRSLWSPRQGLAVVNSYVVGHEADLLVIHDTDWITEVEIKVSVSDFRAEFKQKRAKHEHLVTGWSKPRYGEPRPSYVHRFLFAMPIDVLAKVESEIPDWAGIVAIDRLDNPKSYYHGKTIPIRKRQGKRLPAAKATKEMREQALISTYYKFWNDPKKFDPIEETSHE